MKRQVIVIGLGRFGSAVTRKLYNLGHDVLAMDKDETRVQEVMGQTTHALSGDATNEHVLRELGVVDYDAAIVAIGLDIMSSVMTSVLLKTLGVPYVVSRAHNELHANTLERIGVDKVVEVESEMGVRLAHSLFNPNVTEYLELTPRVGVSKLRVPDRFLNMTLKEVGFSDPRDKNGLSLLAIQRGDHVNLHPEQGDKFKRGDWLLLAGRDDLVERLESAEE
jgi:trk system potassium uptake protein TrkA